MANAVYTKFKQNLADGLIDLKDAVIKVVGVDSLDYTPNLATHAALSDIPAAGRVATSAALTTKTVTDGVWDADDTVLSGTGGDPFEYLAAYVDSGVEATSYLIFLFDTMDGLPFTPPAGAWTLDVRWDNGANKILKIG